MSMHSHHTIIIMSSTIYNNISISCISVRSTNIMTSIS